MSLENPSTAVGPLISTPDSPSSNALPTLMVTWAVDEFFGGMTAMCIKRAHIFHESGVPSAIVSFAPDPDLARIRTSLIKMGKLSPDVPIVNMHEYYDQNYPEKPDPDFKATNLDSTAWTDPHDTYRTTDQSLFSREFTVDSPIALRRIDYYRHDGSVYLTDHTVPQVKDPSKTKRILQLFGPASEPVAEFSSAAKLYRHWLSVIAGSSDTNVIVDSKYSAGFLGTWKHPGAVKLYLFHSTHVTPGEDTRTGSLTKAHAPIIEQRGAWDGLVFLTHSQRSAFTERFGEDVSSYVVGNPTQGPASYPPAEQRETRKIVCVGRLTAGKNVDEVVNIINLVLQSGEAVSLDIIGDGTRRKNLEAQVRELGLEENVKFLGHVNSVAEHLVKANMLLLCSSYEGQSLAILEAQAHGCIPIAYDVDFGPRDVIEDGVSGFLVPYKDKSTAASIIERLVNDEQLCSTISQNAFNRAANFSNESTFNRWQRTLATARENKMLSELLTAIKPVLEGMRFLKGGAIELTVGWEQHQLDFDSVELLIEPRGTSSLESQVVLDSSTMINGTATFMIPSDLRTTTDSKEPLDLSVRLRSGDAQVVLRLGAPKGQVLQPYLTAYGNLSLK